MHRRGFLTGAGAAALAAGGGLGRAQSGARRLPILPLRDLIGGTGARIPLTLAPGTHDFGTGVASQTLGINADDLGPVLRVAKGQTLPFDLTNGRHIRGWRA